MGDAGELSDFQDPWGPQHSGLDYDVFIIGAGLSGLYSIIKMRQLGLRVTAVEAGTGVGGTWYWNRYPGARFDSESWSYGFSFSQELLDEWHWKEQFSPQPETLKYANYIADKFDLRRDIQFETRIKSSHWQESTRSWLLIDEAGSEYTTKFLITAMGPLNAPTLPNIPGVHDFKGIAHHTARWPRDKPVEFENKKVAIIGTGATAIQAIQEIVKTVGHLTVFQRTPNWTAPLRNAEISVEEMAEIRKNYPEIFRKCASTTNCFVHTADTRRTLDVPEEERQAFWEEIYAKPGFSKWLGNFADIGIDKEANDLFSAFMSNKIRQRVKDPWTADKLIPKCHGFGLRRVPLEINYYECFNQPNVRLVDLNEDPLVRITEKGIDTFAEKHEFDMIIYATGFDAITGAFDAIDFRGINGMKLKDRWTGGPKTFLGFTVESFPNMFMVMGPHQAFGNIPRSIEYAVNWISALIKYCKENNVNYVEAKPEGVQWWTQHVHDSSKGLLSNEVDSWMTGVNKNVAGKQTRIIARYNAGSVVFREKCDKVAADDYKRFLLKS